MELSPITVAPPTVDASKVPAGPAKSGDDATGIHETAIKLEDGVAVKPESEMDETLVKAEPGSVVRYCPSWSAQTNRFQGQAAPICMSYAPFVHTVSLNITLLGYRSSS